jgi:hypothetical protein
MDSASIYWFLDKAIMDVTSGTSRRLGCIGGDAMRWKATAGQPVDFPRHLWTCSLDRARANEGRRTPY